MSPSRGTQRRSVRIPDQLWTAAAARARAEGVSVSDVIRAALEAYVSGGESLQSSHTAQPSFPRVWRGHPPAG
ncbi:ribbon-helix-helix protein, CopG family [Mycobacterium ostraviense]|uniref:ribbon-helix-helix protein, CopG family n=1 Tax=Mycobacterium ostraviense TaxID=2738409 RepID=UPI00137B2920